MSTMWPDPVPGAPYTSRSLVQMALAVAAREASDYARSMVPTGPRRAAYDGTLLAGAVRLQELAQRVLELAVVVEREDGTEWDEIDEQLGPDADVRGLEQRWRDQVGRAAVPGCADDDLPEVLLDDPADPLAALFEREALVHDALATSDDIAAGDHAADAARARARAAELRNRAGPNGEQTP